MLPVLSVDHSRVKLNFTTSKNDSDYINASFIKVDQHGQLDRPTLTSSRICWWLFLGGVEFHRVHCHSGSFAPHIVGLLQDALGVQHRGTARTSEGVPGSSTTHSHALVLMMWFLFSCLASGCDNGLSRIRDGQGNAVFLSFLWFYFLSLIF